MLIICSRHEDWKLIKSVNIQEYFQTQSNPKTIWNSENNGCVSETTKHKTTLISSNTFFLVFLNQLRIPILMFIRNLLFAFFALRHCGVGWACAQIYEARNPKYWIAHMLRPHILHIFWWLVPNLRSHRLEPRGSVFCAFSLRKVWKLFSNYLRDQFLTRGIFVNNRWRQHVQISF